VKFRGGVDPNEAVQRHGLIIAEHITGIDVYVLLAPEGRSSEVIAELQADPDVEFAEPNGVMTVPEEPRAPSSRCPESPAVQP
jgi:hypothetical protein